MLGILDAFLHRGDEGGAIGLIEPGRQRIQGGRSLDAHKHVSQVLQDMPEFVPL